MVRGIGWLELPSGSNAEVYPPTCRGTVDDVIRVRYLKLAWCYQPTVSFCNLQSWLLCFIMRVPNETHGCGLNGRQKAAWYILRFRYRSPTSFRCVIMSATGGSNQTVNNCRFTYLGKQNLNVLELKRFVTLVASHHYSSSLQLTLSPRVKRSTC